MIETKVLKTKSTTLSCVFITNWKSYIFCCEINNSGLIYRGQFHFHRTVFPSHLKSRVGLALVKAVALRINLSIDGVPITSRTHTHPSHSQTSRLLTSSLSLGVPVPRATHSSPLVFSLSSHRHSYIGLVFNSLFIDS
jgi:hypothetical protein